MGGVGVPVDLGGVAESGGAGRAENIASRLYPHRVSLCTVGLGSFLCGALPLAAVVEGYATLGAWQGIVFAASVPATLWPLCLALFAVFFEPRRGIVETLCQGRRPLKPWVRSVVRGYATVTVAAFAAAPAVVWIAAASL